MMHIAQRMSTLCVLPVGGPVVMMGYATEMGQNPDGIGGSLTPKGMGRIVGEPLTASTV